MKTTKLIETHEELKKALIKSYYEATALYNQISDELWITEEVEKILTRIDYMQEAIRKANYHEYRIYKAIKKVQNL